MAGEDEVRGGKSITGVSVNVRCFNVGHGDGIVVSIINDSWSKWFVVDCHNPSKVRPSALLTFLLNKKVDHIDAVCLTHPHADHFSGLSDLLHAYTTEGRSIGSLVDCSMLVESIRNSFNDPDEKKRYNAYARTAQALIDDGIIKEHKLSLKDYNLFKTDNLSVDVVSPAETEILSIIKQCRNHSDRSETEEGSITKLAFDANLLSVVIRVTVGKRAIILCGDAPVATIEDAIVKGRLTPLSFVKVSHHGSLANHHQKLWVRHSRRNSTVACISCGRRAGLPHKTVVDSIKARGVRLYCTTTPAYFVSMADKTKDAYSRLPASAVDALTLNTIPRQTHLPWHGYVEYTTDGNKHSTSSETGLPPL